MSVNYIKVQVLSVRGAWEDETWTAQQFREILDQIPAEHADTGYVRFETDDGSGEIEVAYTRPETDEEVRAREADEQLRRQRNEEQARAYKLQMYLTLKSEFEGK